MTQNEQRGPLAGLRILDLANETAAFGGKLLAELGADVLRIEPPEGDPIRRLGPFAGDIVDPERSLSHWWFNSGKRSAVLDWRTPAGRGRIAGLAEQADAIVETGETGIDFAAWQAAHPATTVISVSPCGRSGPRRDWQAPDLVAWALGGGLSTTGLPDRPPLHGNWLLTYHTTGIYAAIGVLAGLAHRRRFGSGHFFDLSVVEATASWVENLIVLHEYTGGIQVRMGVEHPSAVPWGSFPTKDGQVIFLPLTQGQWLALLEWMKETGEVESWALDEALVPMAARTPRRAQIHEWLGRWTAQFESAEFVAEANRRRLPGARINTALDVLADEQLQARGYFVPVEQPSIGRAVPVPGLPYQFRDGATLRAAPLFNSSAPEFLAAPTGGSDSAAPNGGTPPFPGSGLPTNEWPLFGVRILDLTWAVAGPQATKVLADLGADVIKIEAPGTGDLLRGLPPHWQNQPDPNWNGHFHRFNRSKRNLSVDLKKPAGVRLVKRLAAWADAIVDNFGAGVMTRLGLGPEELAAVNPRLVQISMSGYGQSGPHRNYPSYALISSARGSIVAGTGYQDGAATGPGIALGDTGAGLQLALAILAALEQRDRTGQGTFVDMSQLEAATVFVGPALLDAAINGRALFCPENHLPDRTVAPHGVYPAAGDDNWVAIAVESDEQWAALAAAIGRPDLAADERLRTTEGRVAAAAEIDAAVTAYTSDRNAIEVARLLQAAGVPAGNAQRAPDLLNNDEQLAARGFYQRVAHPDIGEIAMDTLPLRWTDGPVPVPAPAPLLGEYNEYVLQSVLGLSDDDLVELIVEEAI